MTIFRHIKNRKLYTLAYAYRYPRGLMATPFNHELKISRPNLKDFIAVSEK
jgi:hypothetical protein